MNYPIKKIGRLQKVGIPEDQGSNNIVWYSRKEIKAYSDGLLHVQNIGKPLKSHPFQVALALSPVTRNELSVDEIQSIEVVKTDYKDTRPVERKCNYVAVTAREKWEYSVIKGIIYLFQGKLALNKKRRESAFRNEIKEQIQDFKLEFESEQNRKYGFQHWHVDHSPPFVKLLNDFIESEQIDVNSIETMTDLSTGGDRLKDERLAHRWACYHYENARLQFLTPEENMRKGAKMVW